MRLPSLRTLAILIGVLLILVGFAGLVPQFVSEGDLLFGVFEVNKPHTYIHIFAGCITLLASIKYTKLFFQIAGILIFFSPILLWNFHFHAVPLNTLDKLFHIGLGVLYLYLGFLYKPNKSKLL